MRASDDVKKRTTLSRVRWRADLRGQFINDRDRVISSAKIQDHDERHRETDAVGACDTLRVPSGIEKSLLSIKTITKSSSRPSRVTTATGNDAIDVAIVFFWHLRAG